MGRLTEMSLLFVLLMASSAFGKSSISLSFTVTLTLLMETPDIMSTGGVY